MAAEVADLPVPLPVLPSMDVDGVDGTSNGKAKHKRHHKFLLPTPKEVVDDDEEMGDAGARVLRRGKRYATEVPACWIIDGPWGILVHLGYITCFNTDPFMRACGWCQ